VARFDLPPERPEVELRIDARGAVRSAVAARWGPADEGGFDYSPCGCHVHAHRSFGELVRPSSLTVSWQFGSASEAPFLKVEITSVRATA
jgi:hypothetical protein